MSVALDEATPTKIVGCARAVAELGLELPVRCSSGRKRQGKRAKRREDEGKKCASHVTPLGLCRSLVLCEFFRHLWLPPLVALLRPKPVDAFGFSSERNLGSVAVVLLNDERPFHGRRGHLHITVNQDGSGRGGA